MSEPKADPANWKAAFESQPSAEEAAENMVKGLKQFNMFRGTEEDVK